MKTPAVENGGLHFTNLRHSIGRHADLVHLRTRKFFTQYGLFLLWVSSVIGLAASCFALGVIA